MTTLTENMIKNIQKDIYDALELARQTHEYKVEGVSLEFTEQIMRRMQELGMSRSELARKVGVKPSYITKILRGDTNYTLDSMVKIATVLDSTFRCNLEPVGCKSQLFYILDQVQRNNKNKPNIDPNEYRSFDIDSVNESLNVEVA